MSASRHHRYRPKDRFLSHGCVLSADRLMTAPGHSLKTVTVLKRLADRIGTGANVALVVLMVAALAFDASRAMRVNAQWVYVVVFGAVVCITALLRARNRTWSVVIGLSAFAVAAVISALSTVGSGQMQVASLIGLVVLAASQARRLPARRAALISAVGAVVVAAAESSHAGGSFNPRALFALFGATVWLGAVGVGTWLRYLDRQRQSAIETIRRDERLELARELHDVVAHHVTGIVVQAQAARFARQDDPAQLSAALAGIEAAGADTMSAIRSLVALMRDPSDTAGNSPSPESIGQLVKRFGLHRTAVDLILPADASMTTWPPEIASTIYRTVQESLTNIARHAPAAEQVAVTIIDAAQHVSIEISNDVPGGIRASHVPTGYGLIGMRERIEALGGTLRAGPLHADRWVVSANLPLPSQSGARP